MQRKLIIVVFAVALAVTLAYANYFVSGLHYGDYGSVRDNPAIRSLLNVPRFFLDSTTASANPAEYVFQPLVTTSLAVDYFLGRGVSPFFLRFDVFLIYLVGLAAIAWLLHSIFELAIPHPWNPYLAVLTAALVGIHPAVAELLNPIASRGELFAALSVVGGLALYAGLPGLRNRFYYLIPPLLGILSNPSALTFGPMLLAYMILVEPPSKAESEEPLSPEQTRSRDETVESVVNAPSEKAAKRIRIRRRKHPFLRYVKRQLSRFMPALLFTLGAGLLHSRVTAFESTGETVIRYWFTQPWVAWRYFRSFFAPYYFSPAGDLKTFASYDGRSVFGIAFLLVLISIALIVAVSRPWRPAVFGIWWFILGILPGAVLVQPYVESDTRMFLPFIGIAMALVWIGRMVLPSGEPLRRLQAIAAAAILVFLGYQTHVRNGIWSTEVSLWQDALKKSPLSVRATEYSGLALAGTGQARAGYEYLLEARRLAPASSEIEAYLGTLSAALKKPEDAEQHFRRALSLGADQAITHFEYAVFLEKERQREQAIDSYDWASSLAIHDLRPRYALMRLYNVAGDWNNLRNTVEAAQPIWHGDPTVAQYAGILRNHPDSVRGAEELAKQNPTPENFLTLSEQYCLAGEFNKCLETAQKALELRPRYSQAYNAIGAAYVSLGRLDDAIVAVTEAVNADPDNKAAHLNLEHWLHDKLLAGNSIMRN